MSQVIEESQETQTQGSEKGRSAVVQAAAVGMALMGSSLARTEAEAHIDHGYAPARWAAAAISGLGWLVGGIAFPMHIWALVAIGAVLQVVAIIVNLAMNAAGMGATANVRWATVKAEAKAARAAAGS